MYLLHFGFVRQSNVISADGMELNKAQYVKYVIKCGHFRDVD